MKPIRARLLSAALLPLFALAACGGDAGSDGDPAAGGGAEAETIDVSMAAFQASFVNYPVYVAEAEGLFEKHGLNVTLTYAAGADVTNALLTGSTDFAAPSTEHIVNMRDEGHDVKSIVQNQAAVPFTIIVANDVETPNADAPYPEMLEDLRGLTIGVSTLGAGTDRTLRYLLNEAGLNPDSDVTITAVGGPATQIAALEQGAIQATMAFEPIQSQAVNGLGIAKPILDMQAGEGPDLFAEYSYNGVAAQTDYIEENPEAVTRMRDAIWEATDFINNPDNLDRSTEIAVEYMNLEYDVLATFLEEYHTIFTPTVTEEGFANVNEFMLLGEEIDEEVPYEEAVATDYMPEGLPFPGSD